MPDHPDPPADAETWPPALSPYIAVADAPAAIEFYRAAFGARPRGAPHLMDDGTIGHAELGIGDAVLMLAQAPTTPDPAYGVPVTAPDAPSTHTTSLHLVVDDVDATVERAAAAGASVERAPADQPQGRSATLVDPHGHRWLLTQAPPHASRVQAGGIGYTSILSPQTTTADFYRDVLGWRLTPGPAGQTVDGHDGIGLAHHTGPPEVRLCFRVTDLDAALTRVRDSGGTVEQTHERPYGRMTDCTAPDGASFQLWQTPR